MEEDLLHKTKEQLIAELTVLRNKLNKREDQKEQSKVSNISNSERAEKQIIAISENSDERAEELVSAEARAKENEVILKASLEAAMDGFWVVDLRGRFLQVNDTYCRMTGYTENELLSLKIVDVEAEQNEDQILENIDKIKDEGQFRFETKHLHKDGSIIDVEIGVKYQAIKGGLFVCFIKDISERKRQELELLESERRFKILAENVPGTIYLCNNDEVFSMIYLNDSVEELTGYKKDDFLNQTISISFLYHKDDIEKIYKDVEDALSKRSQFHLQYRLRKKSGEYIWVEEFGSGVFEDEKLIFLEGILFDVTDRVNKARELTEAKEKAEESESNYRFIASNTSDSIWVMDADLHFTYISPSTEKLFGYSIEAWKTLDWNDFVRPDYLKNVMDTFSKLKSEKGKSNPTISVVVRHKNGTEMWVEFSVNAIFDDYGKFTGAVGISRDITKRKQIELELAESVERFRALHNASFGGITIHDKGIILECNYGLSKITGYSYEELIGMDGLLLIAESKRAFVMDKIQSGFEEAYEAIGLRKNGEEYPMRLEARVIPYKGKNVRVVEFRDITQTRYAEEALHKSEAIKNTMLSNIGDVIVIIDLEGINRYKSPNITKLFGWFPDDLVGKSVWSNIHPEDLEAVQDFFNSIICRPNASGISEYRYKCKDGSYVWIEIKLINLMHDKDIKGILGNYHDVSERKLAAQELIAAKEKAEESDRLKSAFLANMSHEIRTPMNGILGFAHLLKESQLSGDEKDEYIQIIEKSGERMLNTINDIIDISKIEAGQVDVVNSEMSVNKVLDEYYSFFVREAQAKGLELNFRPSLSDGESHIITDQQKFASIITNLIKNAIKYTESGSITFGYNLKSLHREDVIEFYVKDTGIGIPGKRVDAIFNRFEQADIEDRRVFEGSGLGLAISKSYVEMLGGEINVSTKEGIGSTFTFTIPYNTRSLKSNDSRLAKEEESLVLLHNLSLIVAEDDQISRMYYEKILENKFKRIFYTVSGEETITLCRENPDTNIILMDIKMPDINGYDACREIRKFNRNIIIIAQTAYGLAGDEERAIEAGCDDYISKPINKEILFEKLQSCLKKKN